MGVPLARLDEHVSATMRMTMRKIWSRCVGLTRNRATIVLTNLVYNMVRYEQIEWPGTWKLESSMNGIGQHKVPSHKKLVFPPLHPLHMQDFAVQHPLIVTIWSGTD